MSQLDNYVRMHTRVAHKKDLGVDTSGSIVLQRMTAQQEP